MAKTYEVKIGSTELELKSFEVERNKLWSDADRNMAGELKATFIGVFPKLVLEFGYLGESDMKSLLGLLEPASLSVSWWDSKLGDYRTGDFYTGDFKYPYWNKSKKMYAPFTVNLIPFKKI
jgi:hypothetical protein